MGTRAKLRNLGETNKVPTPAYTPELLTDVFHPSHRPPSVAKTVLPFPPSNTVHIQSEGCPILVHRCCQNEGRTRTRTR